MFDGLSLARPRPLSLQDFKVFDGVAPDDFAKQLTGTLVTGAGRKVIVPKEP